ESFSRCEPPLNVLHIAVTETLIGKCPDGAVGASPVHPIADRHEAPPVERTLGPSEERDILPEDLPVAPFIQPRGVWDLLTVLSRYLEISPSLLVPVADLLHRKLKPFEDRTRRLVPVHPAQCDQMRRVVIGPEFVRGPELDTAGGIGRPQMPEQLH